MKPLTKLPSFSQMSKQKEGISEAKMGKNYIEKWKYRSFIEIWKFKLFKAGTMKRKARVYRPSVCSKEESLENIPSCQRHRIGNQSPAYLNHYLKTGSQEQSLYLGCLAWSPWSYIPWRIHQLQKSTGKERWDKTAKWNPGLQK